MRSRALIMGKWNCVVVVVVVVVVVCQPDPTLQQGAHSPPLRITMSFTHDLDFASFKRSRPTKGNDEPAGTRRSTISVAGLLRRRSGEKRGHTILLCKRPITWPRREAKPHLTLTKSPFHGPKSQQVTVQIS